MTRENLEKLKVIQIQIADSKDALKERKEAFEKSEKGAMDFIANLQSQETLYKQGIEVEALAEFKETGKKTLLGGIKVQEKKIVTISYKPEDALKFAKDKDMFLMFDKKGLEKAIPSLGELKWVTTKTETIGKVTFPTAGIKLEDN